LTLSVITDTGELMSTKIHRVTLIPGDGTGPEIADATRRVLEASGARFDWDVRHAGADVMDEYGTPLPDEVLDSSSKARPRPAS
jgi:isocitrate dehydrogenase (NAD+)